MFTLDSELSNVLERPSNNGHLLKKHIVFFIMSGASLKGANSSFWKHISFCHSIFMETVIFAFMFEQCSYFSCKTVIVF